MADTEAASITPWKDGYWRALGYPSMLWVVDGNNFVNFPASGKPTNQDNPMNKGTFSFGDFGDAHDEVAKETGKKRYNVEISAWGGSWKPHAVLNDDGTKLTYYGMARSIDSMVWMSKEEVEEYKASGDPASSPPNNYKMQPENQGKLLWLSGAPGLGKSTSGLMLNKKAGYVYYEADCFMNHLNPYVPTDVDEPTLAMFTQKFLKGVSQERLDVVAEGVIDFMGMIDGKEYNFEKLCQFYSAMSKDIDTEQKRIGGDWAVAHAVPTRKFRDHIRKQLGSNLIFVVLHMSKEDQVERIKGRHGDDAMFVDMLTKSYDVFEPAEDDEPNTISIQVTKEMTRDDVADKILQKVKDYKSNL